MEKTVGGVSIQVNPNLYEFNEIMNDLFGSDYSISEEYNIRDHNSYQLLKDDSSITILNRKLVDCFFKKDNSFVQDIINYFNIPTLIVAYQFYDKGDTYGYSIIKNGVLIRQVQISSYKMLIDFGELEDWEINWKNGPTKQEDLGGDYYQTILINSETGEESEEFNLVQYGIERTLLNEFGFDFDDMEQNNYLYSKHD